MFRKPDDYRLVVPDALATLASPSRLEELGRWVAVRVLRTDLSRPGFALLDLGTEFDPSAFRKLLIALGDQLDLYCRQELGTQLAYLSAGCFDQQSSTRPHRDGAPEESILVLGYEPTSVASRLFLLDYTAAALAAGTTPREWLARVGVACTGCEDALRDWTTEVTGWVPGHFQVLAINNSSATTKRGMLGVLHQALVVRDPSQRRPVNSLTLAVPGPDLPRPLSAEEVRAFVAGPSRS